MLKKSKSKEGSKVSFEAKRDETRNVQKTHLLEDLVQLSLVLDGEEDLLAGNVRDGVEELLDDGGRAVKFESQFDESLSDGSHLRLGDVSTDEDSGTGSRDLETVDGEEGSPEREEKKQREKLSVEGENRATRKKRR